MNRTNKEIRRIRERPAGDRRRSWRGAWAVLPMLFLGWLAGCSPGDGGRVVRLGHGLDVGHPVHLAMERMAEQVQADSAGRLRIEIYPGEQLGSERECLELLQIGSLGMTKVSASVLENFAPSFRILGMPYLFRDREHARTVLDGPIGRQLLLGAQGVRLRGLVFYDAGSRSFYTRERPVHSPEDLGGLKIRTQESATAMSLVSALGGSPTPIAWGELYTALQQGVVDGAENNPPSFHLSRHYEVARHYTLDEHTSVPDVLLISTLVWDRLSEAERGWLGEAAAASARYQREIWRRASDQALAAVEQAGVTIWRPDKEAFSARTEALYEELRRTDPELYELGRRIRAVRASEESRGEEAAPEVGP